MKTVTINVPDNKYSSFMKVVKSIDYAKVEQPKKKLNKRQQAMLVKLNEALEEVELHLQGKITLPTLKEVLDEL